MVDAAWDLLDMVSGVTFNTGGVGCSFYSRVYEALTPPLVAQRSGPVHSATKAMFLEACAEDEVVMFAGHGGAVSAERPYRLILECGNPDESVTFEDIVPGSMTQCKLVYLGCCHGLDLDVEFQSQVIGYRMWSTGGAHAIIGYNGSAVMGGEDGCGAEWLSERTWIYLRNGAASGSAVDYAKQDWADTFPAQDPAEWGVDAYTSLGSATIAPAF